MLLHNLEAMREALLAYRIRGVEGLEDEIDRTYGSLRRHWTEEWAGMRTEWSASSGADVKQVFEWMDRANKVVTLAKNAKDLGVPALKFLGEYLKLPPS